MKSRFSDLVILVFFIVAALTSCKKDEKTTNDTTGNVEVIFVPKAGNQPLRMDEPITTPAGEQLSIKEFKFFVADLGLAMMNSREEKAIPLSTDLNQSGVWLIDFTKPNFDAGFGNQAYKIQFKAPEGKYADVRFSVKVPREYNMADMTTNPYPMNEKNGMYWSWNSGFKFLVINGSSPVAAGPIHLSIGLDYRAATYNFRSMALASSRDGIEVAKGKTTRIVFEYDVNALLTNTDGSLYSFVQTPGRASVTQVHGGVMSDVLFANSASAIELKEFKLQN